MLAAAASPQPSYLLHTLVCLLLALIFHASSKGTAFPITKTTPLKGEKKAESNQLEAREERNSATRPICYELPFIVTVFVLEEMTKERKKRGHPTQQLEHEVGNVLAST